MSTPDGRPGPDPADLRAMAQALRELLDLSARALREEAGISPLGQRVIAHLGCGLSGVVSVSQRFPVWDQVNVQRGVDAYLSERGGGAWFGLPGLGHRGHEGLLPLTGPAFGAHPLGPASWTTAPSGPQENTEVVKLGLVTASAPDGAPVVIGLHSERNFGPPYCDLEVFAADQAAATAARDAIAAMIRAHNVFRGQVLSFTQSEHHGNELVSFLPRPALRAQDVVLPAGVLDAIEDHVIGVADWSPDLLRAGQHLKRGLLLHGPPGTGKTHTVRYLASRLTRCTVILLTGMSIRFIDHAAAMARGLQPSIVVLEDVDLIAEDRDYAPAGNPLLFSLLEAMDGIGTDADVTFVLTTNRADILEAALADRPGRIDLAVEIPRPDARCREQLIRLYARDLTLDADLEPVVAGTEGVTASFVKELIRRTVLASLRAGDRPPVLRDAHFADVLAGMTSERHALTRTLLGGDTGAEPPPRRRRPG